MKNPVLHRFLRRKVSVAAACVLLVIVLACVLGPVFIHTDPLAQDLLQSYQNPSAEHWVGTDNLGRDTFIRILYGGRNSLKISFEGVALGTVLGVLLGVCAGYFGGVVDTLICRLVDILLAFPGLLLAIAVVAVLGNGMQNTVIAISIFSIPGMARMVRGEVLTLRNSEYIAACRVMGEGNAQIIFMHVIPNAVSQIIVNATLSLGTAILTASSLSFLGLGVTPPDPEWGSMLSQAREVLRSSPLQAVIPGLAITLTVMSFSLVGDGLRDALDPRLKNV